MESLSNSAQQKTIGPIRSFVANLFCVLSGFILVFPGVSMLNFTFGPDYAENRLFAYAFFFLLVSLPIIPALALKGWARWKQVLGTILRITGFVYFAFALFFFLLALVAMPIKSIRDLGHEFVSLFLFSALLIVLGFLLKGGKRTPTKPPPQAKQPITYEEFLTHEHILARRAGAAIIDYIIFFCISFTYLAHFGDKIGPLNYRGDGFHFLMIFVIWFFYFPVTEAISGRTLSKLLLKLKVLKERDYDSSLKVSFLRHLCDLIDFSFFGAPAIISVRITKEHKRIGDFLAHSKVVISVQPELRLPNRSLKPTP